MLGREVLVDIAAIPSGVFFSATALRGVRVSDRSGEVPPVWHVRRGLRRLLPRPGSLLRLGRHLLLPVLPHGSAGKEVRALASSDTLLAKYLHQQFLLRHRVPRITPQTWPEVWDGGCWFLSISLGDCKAPNSQDGTNCSTRSSFMTKAKQLHNYLCYTVNLNLLKH